MKKFLIPAIALSFLMATTVLADPYATLETIDGNVSIVGFTTAEDSDGAACFVALLEYENKKEESNSPLFEFSIKAYQDGVELDSGYIYNYSFENYKDSDTNVRPGSTLKYFQIFKLEGNSPVDVEVAPMFNFDNQHAEYTFDLSEEMIPENTGGSSETETGGSSTVADKIAELEQRIAELEQRVDELEKK